MSFPLISFLYLSFIPLFFYLSFLLLILFQHSFPLFFPITFIFLLSSINSRVCSFITPVSSFIPLFLPLHFFQNSSVPIILPYDLPFPTSHVMEFPLFLYPFSFLLHLRLTPHPFFSSIYQSHRGTDAGCIQRLTSIQAQHLPGCRNRSGKARTLDR